MRDRPYAPLSSCVSIDGYIGNAASRLLPASPMQVAVPGTHARAPGRTQVTLKRQPLGETGRGCSPVGTAARRPRTAAKQK